LQLVVDDDDNANDNDDNDSDSGNTSTTTTTTTSQPQRSTSSALMKAIVPGDIVTDLVNNNWYNEPYYNNNFQNTSFCDDMNMNMNNELTNETSSERKHLLWEYSIEFDISNYTSSSLLIVDDDNNSNSNSNSFTSTFLLVFDGIKMGSKIYLNNQYLGTTTDQFLRYTYPLSSNDIILNNNNNNNNNNNKAGGNKTTMNKLVVQFDTVGILTNGRFSACGGGWDWAPYSNCPHTTDTNSRTYTFGITKSVYIVGGSSTTTTTIKSSKSKSLKSSSAAAASSAASAFITAIVPQVMYRGEYPIQSLVDGDHDGFDIDVRVHLLLLSSPLAAGNHHLGLIKGRLEVQGMWGSQDVISKIIQLDNGGSSTTETNVTLSLVANSKDIKLWWPTGMGPTTMYYGNADEESLPSEERLTKRHLYDIQVRFIPLDENNNGDDKSTNQPPNNVIQDTRRIGFRHFALVTGNDTDKNYVHNAKNKQGTEFHGMYYRINGVAIWSRGANMIPMDILDGRYTTQGHIQIIKSAIHANMNTLRVWGGGIFLPKIWYDICDEYGILVIQDQMYVTLLYFSWVFLQLSPFLLLVLVLPRRSYPSFSYDSTPSLSFFSFPPRIHSFSHS
jgi:hypothetical protein